MGRGDTSEPGDGVVCCVSILQVVYVWNETMEKTGKA
jgi:hypothetical protein